MKLLPQTILLHDQDNLPLDVDGDNITLYANNVPFIYTLSSFDTISVVEILENKTIRKPDRNAWIFLNERGNLILSNVQPNKSGSTFPQYPIHGSYFYNTLDKRSYIFDDVWVERPMLLLASVSGTTVKMVARYADSLNHLTDLSDELFYKGYRINGVKSNVHFDSQYIPFNSTIKVKKTAESIASGQLVNLKNDYAYLAIDKDVDGVALFSSPKNTIGYFISEGVVKNFTSSDKNFTAFLGNYGQISNTPDNKTHFQIIGQIINGDLIVDIKNSERIQ